MRTDYISVRANDSDLLFGGCVCDFHGGEFFFWDLICKIEGSFYLMYQSDVEWSENRYGIEYARNRICSCII